MGNGASRPSARAAAICDAALVCCCALPLGIAPRCPDRRSTGWRGSCGPPVTAPGSEPGAARSRRAPPSDSDRHHLNCFLLVIHGFSETDNETWQSSASIAHLPTWIGAWPLSDRRLESLTVARARSVLAAKRRAQASPARGTYYVGERVGRGVERTLARLAPIRTQVVPRLTGGSV